MRGMGTAVKRLILRVRRLTQRAAALLNDLTDVNEELGDVCRAIEQDASGRIDTAVELALARAAEAKRREALRAATTGARTLEMRPAPKGAAVVRIDGGEPFHLSRGDARLLKLLAQAPVERDGFPGWLSYEDIMDRVQQKTGTSPTRHAIVEAVHRVRKALKAADNNEFLVQVDRRRGRMRFLLRVPGAQS